MSDYNSLMSEIKSIKSENIRHRQRTEDILHNLDESNMPQVWSKIRRYQNATNEAIAVLNLSATDLGAQISAVAQHQGDTDCAIASLELEASEQGSQISLVAENGAIKAAAIVAAINNQSYASISADRINFTGFTTFLRPGDLGQNGTTTIDGARISTGTLSTDKLAKNSSFAIEFNSDIYTEHSIMFSDGYDIIASMYAGGGSSVRLNSLGGFYANDGFVISDAYINSYIDSRLFYWSLI